MAYDLWDESIVRKLPSWETFAGHSGQRALIVRNHRWTVSRKVRASNSWRRLLGADCQRAQGRAHQLLGKATHHFSQTLVAENDEAPGGNRSRTLVHPFDEQAIGLVRGLQGEHLRTRWTLYHQRPHITAADRFQSLCRSRQARSQPVSARFAPPFGEVYSPLHLQTDPLPCGRFSGAFPTVLS